MQKGFSVPIIVIVILLFVLAPVGFYYLVHSQNQDSVKGVSTSAFGGNGFVFYVNSTGGTWDLAEYLCKDMTECVESATSGELYGQISGGETQDHEIYVKASDDWSGYKFMKIVMTSGWGTTPRNYNIDATVGEVRVMEASDNPVQVLLVPLTGAEQSSVIEIASFSD